MEQGAAGGERIGFGGAAGTSTPALPDVSEIEAIFRRTLKAVEDGFERMGELVASLKAEYQRTRQAYETVKQEALRCVEQVDELEAKSRLARYELFRVSRDYQRYSEEDVRRAYEQAERLQLLLGEVRERERSLRERRAELERSLARLSELLEQSEGLQANLKAARDALAGRVPALQTQLSEWQTRYEMGRRIITAQEQERRRLARELHDGAAQGLASIGVEMELCERLLDTGVEPARRQLARVRTLVRETLGDLRRVIFDLRPLILDELGVIAAIRRYADHLNDLGPPRVEVTVHGFERRLDSALEVAIYRVVQEAVGNARRHAGASRVGVVVELGSDFVNVVVRDDGRGFDPHEARSRATQVGHLGLFGMAERVEVLGGRFSIQSAPGSGTRVSARFPVPPESPAAGS